MKDKRKMKKQLIVLTVVTLGVMLIDLYVLCMAFELRRHIALCVTIMLLTGIALVYDYKLKDVKLVILHYGWMGAWAGILLFYLS